MVELFWFSFFDFLEQAPFSRACFSEFFSLNFYRAAMAEKGEYQRFRDNLRQIFQFFPIFVLYITQIPILGDSPLE